MSRFHSRKPEHCSDKKTCCGSRPRNTILGLICSNIYPSAPYLRRISVVYCSDCVPITSGAGWNSGHRTWEAGLLFTSFSGREKVPSTSPSATVAAEAGADAAQGQLALKLFGFEPKAKLKSTGTISYNQLELSGDGITTKALDQLMADEETLKTIQSYSGRIYIVEAVYRTASLDATSSSAISGEAGTSAMEDCPADVLRPVLPPKPTVSTPRVDQAPLPRGQAGAESGQVPRTTPESSTTPATQQTPKTSGAPTTGSALADAAKTNAKLKLPWSAGASGCKGRVGEVHLATTKPIALAMKINEVIYSREKDRSTGVWGAWHWTYTGAQLAFK